MTIGKQIRLSRFRYPQSRLGMIVPIDHGLTLGPVEGLQSVSRTASWITHPALTGIIAHKGMIERLARQGLLGGAGVMLHLNGMSAIASSPDRKEMLTSLDTALRLGVDGVSVQVNFDGTNDAHNLTLLGKVVDSAANYGLPVLTMLYDKVQINDDTKRIVRFRHLMRIAMELGSDALKIGVPARLEEIPELIDGISEDIAIYFAGGSLCDDETLFSIVRLAVSNGGAGLCVGRNVFQRAAPGEFLNKLASVILRTDKNLFPIKEQAGHEIGIH